MKNEKTENSDSLNLNELFRNLDPNKYREAIKKSEKETADYFKGKAKLEEMLKEKEGENNE